MFHKVFGAYSEPDSVAACADAHRLLGVGIYVIDAQRMVLSASDPLGLLPGAIDVQSDPAQSPRDLVATLGEGEAGSVISQVLAGGPPARITSTADGVDRWVEISAIRRGDEFVVCCRDVTVERSRTEALTDSARRLRSMAALLDVTTDAAFVRELDDSISFWSRGAATLYGLPADQALGSSARLLLQDDPRDFDAATTQLLQNGEWSGELTQTRSDGSSWIASCRWQVDWADDGTPLGLLCVMTDVTDAKQEEEALFRAQRLDSIGSLAGGMAHDLNNVLTPILLSAQLLALDEDDPDRQVMLGSIQTSAERGADMIRQVLSFARGEESRRGKVDVRSLVEQLNTFCTEVLQKSITVVTQVDPDIPPVFGDSTQLLQVLMNFVTNARDAMPSGGSLTITAKAVRERSDVAFTDEWSMVSIAVQDTGIGMTEETLALVFEPFFTTKETGAGTGLGLSTSISIARGHGGDVTVESTLGRGSRFVLRLPLSTTEAGTTVPIAGSTATDRVRGQGERVLIIDDESTIRTIVQHTLEADGYLTTSAGDGYEAILLLEESPASFDLVLTDMMMPVMDGAAVAAYLAEYHPEIPLVAASGVTSTEELVRAAHLGVETFLAKPFSTEELLGAVRKALDGSSSVRAASEKSDNAPARVIPADEFTALSGIAALKERVRVAAVHDLGLLDTPPEQRFDRITEFAQAMFGVPLAQINILEEDSQFTKSPQKPGSTNRLDRVDTLCDVTIQQPEILIVPDALADPRFATRGGVVDDPHVRFYAGKSVGVDYGRPLGAVCLIDTAPRFLLPSEEQLLEELGLWVERELRHPPADTRRSEMTQSFAPRDQIGRTGYDISGNRLPGRHISGTFFDWDEVDGLLSLTVLDVMGAGGGSALVAASIQSAFRARRHLDPLETIYGVHDQLALDLRASDVAAAVFHARFDPQTGRLDYVDAGNGLGVVVTGFGDVSSLAPTGLPLGIAIKTGWSMQTVHLQAGDALVAMTPGLGATDPDGPTPAAQIASFVGQSSTAHEIITRITADARSESDRNEVAILALTLPLVAQVAAPLAALELS